MGSSAASPSASPRPTASSRPPLAPAARAIRAAVASGGYLVDRAIERGAVRREYVGGDVAIATVPRGCDFRAFLVAVGVEPPPRDAILDRDDDMNDADANANDEESPNNVIPILRAAERARCTTATRATASRSSASGGTTTSRACSRSGRRRGGETTRLRDDGRKTSRVRLDRRARRRRRRRAPSPSSPGRGGDDRRDPRGLLRGVVVVTRGRRRRSTRGRLRRRRGGGGASGDSQRGTRARNRLGGGAFGEVRTWRSGAGPRCVKFLHALREDAFDSDSDDDDDVEAAVAAAAAAARLEGGVSGDRPGRRGGDFSGSQTLPSPSGAARAARGGHPAEEEFLRESRTMAALQHPNVVFVYGVVRDGARLGIVEEFMRSGSLRRLLNAHERELAKSPPVPPASGSTR